MKLLLIILFIFIASTAFADALSIPFSCWAQDLKVEFAKVGRKLDLDPNERTVESWGYLKNEGSSYTIFTYNSVRDEDFTIIMEIVNKVELRERE